jgi:hypothetical protein
MSREASRERLRTLAASLGQLSARLAEPALMGYPVALLCNPAQRPALQRRATQSPLASAGAAPLLEARSAAPYKE